MKLSLLFLSALLYTQAALANIQGVYKSVFYHQPSKTAYYAEIILFTENPHGQGVEVSADVTFFFSEANSAESLRFSYPKVNYDIFTGKFTLECEASPLKMSFVWENDTLSGTWLLRKTGAFGAIKAQTDTYPEIEEGFKNLSSLGGEYRGTFTRTNNKSRLPERISFSFLVTTDHSNPNQPKPKVRGYAKFYIGNFGSNEYVKVKFKPIHYNFYDRTLVLVGKIRNRTFTISANLSPDGKLSGVLSETSLGELGNLELEKVTDDLDTIFEEIDDPSPLLAIQYSFFRTRF